MIWRH